MKLRKHLVLVPLVLALSALMAACSPKEIDATLGQYDLTLSPASIRSGEITFHIHNDAAVLVHEFVIVKSDLPADSFTVGPNGTVDESKMTVVGEVEDIHPGESADLTITLESGHYIIVCNLPTHYGLGMFTEFSVRP